MGVIKLIMVLFWFLNHQLEGKMTYMLLLINTQLTPTFMGDFLVMEPTACRAVFILLTTASQFTMFVQWGCQSWDLQCKNSITWILVQKPHVLW